GGADGGGKGSGRCGRGQRPVRRGAHAQSAEVGKNGKNGKNGAGDERKRASQSGQQRTLSPVKGQPNALAHSWLGAASTMVHTVPIVLTERRGCAGWRARTWRVVVRLACAARRPCATRALALPSQ